MLCGANQFVGEPVPISAAAALDEESAPTLRDNGGGGGRTGRVRREEVSGEPSKTYSIEVAKARLDRCTVGLLEEWGDTKLVIRHWFPWMEFT